MADEEQKPSNTVGTAEAKPAEEKPTGEVDTTVDKPEDGDNVLKPPADNEPEIPVRTSAKSFIDARRSKRLGKIEKPAGEGAVDGDEVDPDDRQVIEQVVDEKLDPLVKAQREQADENELRQVITDHPEFKPYEKLIRKNMVIHTTMPILQLAYAVVGEKLVALGTKKKTEADEEAKEQNLGASTTRKEPDKLPDFLKMSRADFQKYLRQAKGQQVQ
jgi:hypothetical protein